MAPGTLRHRSGRRRSGLRPRAWRWPAGLALIVGLPWATLQPRPVFAEEAAVAISPEGLRFLEQQLPRTVPATYPIDATEERELASCLGHETTLQVKGGSGRVDLDGLTLRATGGKLVIQLSRAARRGSSPST
ncbi:MAG: hypothetical protein IPG96_12705 [Proteobacteria bacterium]|nr:hypothetical protein [Pseudomonadota bacterium]